MKIKYRKKIVVKIKVLKSFNRCRYQNFDLGIFFDSQSKSFEIYNYSKEKHKNLSLVAGGGGGDNETQKFF